jgi:hypothetical protein
MPSARVVRRESVPLLNLPITSAAAYSMSFAVGSEAVGRIARARRLTFASNLSTSCSSVDQTRTQRARPLRRLHRLAERQRRLAIDRHHGHFRRRQARPTHAKQPAEPEVLFQRRRERCQREHRADQRDQHAQAETLVRKRHGMGRYRIGCRQVLDKPGVGHSASHSAEP